MKTKYELKITGYGKKTLNFGPKVLLNNSANCQLQYALHLL